MPANHTEIEKKLWASADELRANSNLKSSEYSIPVLGLIFLRFADQRFAHVEQELTSTVHVGSRRTIGKADYQARGVMYLPPQARFSYLLSLYFPACVRVLLWSGQECVCDGELSSR